MALLVKPDVLQGIAVALLVLAVLWVTVIGFSHLSLRPANQSITQRASPARRWSALFSFAVAAPLAFGANIAYSASYLRNAIFAPSDDDSQSETQPTIQLGRPVDREGPAQHPDPGRGLRHQPVLDPR